MMKKLILLFVCLMSCIWAFAQDPATGMDFDDDAYQKVPRKANLLKRDYENLPAKASLKQYCPFPRNQGQFGTCVGWSSAYAARTIVEARNKKMTDRNQISNEAFSPMFVYHMIRQDEGCANGTFINDALETMKDKGVVKFDQLTENCPDVEIDDEVLEIATPNKISDFARLFADQETVPVKMKAMKKALAAGNPVVIGMKVPPSFFKVTYSWEPAPEDNPGNKYGGHAMCVIGYDDAELDGRGAFEIQNSWGAQWGNGGYIWVSYDAFMAYTKYAYEVIAIPSATDASNNGVVQDLSGEILYQTASSEDMKAKFVNMNGNIGYYQMESSYKSGTKFRIYITNNQPAFVYAIGSDMTTGNLFPIFPNEEGISPALTYPANAVAIPDENYFVQMDNTKGKDYMCVLYSKEPLDIKTIQSKISKESGTFADKINKAFGDKLVANPTCKDANGKMQFGANSEGKTIMAVIVEIDHI